MEREHNRHLFYFTQMSFKIILKQICPGLCLPVQHVVVLQILRAPATLYIFDHMVLQKLLQELHRLLPGDIRAKIAVATEQLVKPLHSGRGREAGGVVPEVLAMFPEGHTGPEQTGHLIPLKEEREFYKD